MKHWSKLMMSYVSEFDMDKAVQESCNYVGRVPNVH